MKRIITILLAIITIATFTLSIGAESANVQHNSGYNGSGSQYINVATTNTTGTIFVYGYEAPYYDTWTQMESATDVGVSFDIPFAVGNFNDFAYDNIQHWNNTQIIDNYFSPFPSDYTDTTLQVSVTTSEIDEYKGTFTNTYSFNTDTIAFIGTTIMASSNLDMGEMNPIQIIAAGSINNPLEYAIEGTHYIIYTEAGKTKSSEHRWSRHIVDSSPFANSNQVSLFPEIEGIDPESIISYAFVGSIIVRSLDTSNLDVVVTYSYSDYGDDAYMPFNYSVGTTPLENPTVQFFTNYQKYTNPEITRYYAEINKNGLHAWNGLYDGGSIEVNVPTYEKGSMLEVKQNGRYDVGNYNYVVVGVPQTVESSNMFEFLFDSIGALLNFRIAPNYTIGGILTFVVGLALIIWLLKVFMGG